MIKNIIDIGIVVLAIVTYFLFILFYFKIKKTKNSKFSSEIFVVLTALLISAIIKALIFIFEFDDYSFNGILGSILAAIFTAIGGLQFEGLPLLGGDFTTEMITGNLKTIYYVTSMWSGTVFLTILSFAISIEFANTVKLRLLLLTNKIFNRKTHYYVFTAVTDDALTLSHSIEQHHKNKEEKCVIIFAGNIGAFDRLNPLCVEIFASGYIYFSINTPVSNKQTIISALKLSKRENVSLFAFELNEKMLAYDEKNAEVIYSETDCMINKLVKTLTTKNLEKEFENCKSSNDKGVEEFDSKKALLVCKRIVNEILPYSINFYVLTRNETNARAFENGIQETFNKVVTNKIPEIENKNEIVGCFWNILSRIIQISHINEASLAAKDLSKKRIEYLTLNNLFEYEDVSNKCYRILTLGFGEKGQACSKQLYESASMIDYKGNTMPFFANIIDDRLNNLSGSFIASHPMFVSYDDKSIDKDNIKKEINKKIDQKLKEIYKCGTDSLDRNTLPVVKFSNISCFSNSFYEYINKTDDKTLCPNLFSYDDIVIALGEDINSIRSANTLIREFLKHFDVMKRNPNEYINNHGKDLQFIAINIRNIDNAKQIERELLNSCKLETIDENGNKVIVKQLKVICFGDAKEMYTYDNIINTEQAKIYSYRYGLLYDLFNKQKEKTSLLQFCDKYYNGKNASLREVIASMKETIATSSSSNQQEIIDENWKKEKSFSKSSNIAAINFKLVYQNYLGKFLDGKLYENSNYEKLLFACKLEHERWMRFHIANGFIYDSNHNKVLKKHCRIVDFDDLPAEVVIYDAINVAMAINTKK